jgi:GNAT superfamily N-acetyltransferase
VELREATAREKVERDRLTYAEWGTTLSLAQYFERERVLRAHRFSRGMQTWLWCDGSTVLASAETYENDSRIGGARGLSWSFASVFTEPPLRGQGHATALMNAVVARLSKRPKAQACVLFSDVGEPIYARSGFLAVPGDDWVLEPLRGAPEKDVEPLVPPFKAPALAAHPGLVLIPHAAQLDWALAREALYARFLRRVRPSFHGARAGDALALWAAYFKTNELIILWLEGSNVEGVLRSARRQAHRCSLDRVRLWALPRARPEGARQRVRHGERPMFYPFRPVTEWLHVQRALWV